MVLCDQLYSAIITATKRFTYLGLQYISVPFLVNSRNIQSRKTPTSWSPSSLYPLLIMQDSTKLWAEPWNPLKESRVNEGRYSLQPVVHKEQPINIKWWVDIDVSHQRLRVSALLPNSMVTRLSGHGSQPLLDRDSPRCTFEITMSPGTNRHCSTQRPSCFLCQQKAQHPSKKTKGWKPFHKYHNGERGRRRRQEVLYSPALSLLS
jgi:hypothetical protein